MYILTGPYWHMIIGGYKGGSLLDTVELFNWKTNQSCSLPQKLPIVISEHSGTVLNGIPIVCGGYGPENELQSSCFQLDKETKTWKNVS